MPKRNLAWLLAILLVVTALWLLLHQRDDTPRPEGPARDLLPSFLEVQDIVEKHFVERLTEEQRRLSWDQAAQAYVDALHDPYSVYIAPDDAEEYMEHVHGKFRGIGIELNPYEPIPTVATVVDSSPAFDAGILAGDRILAVGSQDVRRLRPQEVARLMRGQPGSPVVLTLYRPGQDPDTGRKFGPLTLAREQIGDDLKSPIKGFMPRPNGKGEWDFLLPQRTAEAPRLGYIRVSDFLENEHDSTSKFFELAISDLLTVGANGLILDLRNNPGGMLTQAIQMVDRFVPYGVIVEERGAYHSRVTRATGHGTLTKWPIVVLINKASASASELVAGSLAFNGRAVLVGERSFGKGTVQELVPVANPLDSSKKGLLKLTVAYLYLPFPPNGFSFDRTEPPADFSKPRPARPKSDSNQPVPSGQPGPPKEPRPGGIKPTVEVSLSPSEQQMVLRCRREIDHPSPVDTNSTTRPDAAVRPRDPAASSSPEEWADKLLQVDRQLKTAIEILGDLNGPKGYQSLLKKAPTTAAEQPDEM